MESPRPPAAPRAGASSPFAPVDAPSATAVPKAPRKKSLRVVCMEGPPIPGSNDTCRRRGLPLECGARRMAGAASELGGDRLQDLPGVVLDLPAELGVLERLIDAALDDAVALVAEGRVGRGGDHVPEGIERACALPAAGGPLLLHAAPVSEVLEGIVPPRCRAVQANFPLINCPPGRTLLAPPAPLRTLGRSGPRHRRSRTTAARPIPPSGDRP